MKNTLREVRQFFGEYKQLAFVVVTVIAAVGFDLAGKDAIAHWILGISAIINVLPLAWGMVEAFRDGSYGLDILALTAIVTSVWLHEYWAGIIIVLMLTGGEALEDYAERRAKKELSALLKNKSRKAHLIKGSDTVDTAVANVKVGDRLRLLPGEVVPVDAEIIEGTSSFDESSLTGESLPVRKATGDTLLSGSVNVEGVIVIRALHTAKDSQYEQIIKLVQSAAVSQSPFVRLADRYSVPFTAVAFLLAGLTWAATGEAIRFLEVIVVATPCPLLLGAPIALISGMSRSAKHGIIVKTGSALERLASVQTFAFDKTGTLTQGVPTIKAIKTFGGFTNAQVLDAAASLEASSNHILGRAIIERALKNGKLTAAKQVKEIAGQGLSGRIKNNAVLVGRRNFLLEKGVVLPAKLDVQETATYVAIGEKLAGVITFVDPLRPETKSMLKRLKQLGIKHTLMVTGDNQKTARTIAKQIGIETVVADCLPGDKIHAIENIKAQPVAFVGDGVNDAPVLTAADVGIALGARGNTAASESADVVIMLNDVSKVATALEIAKRTFSIARQSILLGIFISLGLMAVFATGKFKPVQGAVLQEFVDVAVIINALRAHSSPKRSK